MVKNKYILSYKKDDGNLVYLLESEDLYVLAYFLILCKTDSSFIEHFRLHHITNFLLCHEYLLDSSLQKSYYEINYNDHRTEKIIKLLYDYDNPNINSSIGLYLWLSKKSIDELDRLLKISEKNGKFDVLPSQHREKDYKVLKRTLLFL